MTVEVFDLGDVFFFLFRNDIGIHDRGVVIATVFLSSIVPEISLVVLFFFASLALINGLPTRYINRGKVSRFILLGVLFLGWFMPLRIL